MSTTKKGTPRKRPYDVKRKLERAIARFKKQGKKLVYGGFGDIETKGGLWCVKPGGCGCVISAWLDGKPSTEDLNGDAARGLGLTRYEVADLWGGFDNPTNPDNQWEQLGGALRSHLEP